MSIGIVASSAVSAGGAFSPADVTGLAAWWDATQIGGLSNGDTVATWADLSGNGLDLTGANTPTYATSGVNGLPSVQLQSANAELLNRSSTAALDLTGNLLVLAAIRPTTASTDTPYTIASKGFTRWELFIFNSLGAYVGGSSNGIFNSGTTLSANTDYIAGMRRTSTSALSTRLNGAQDATATNSASGTATADFHLGARPGTGLYYDGYIGEVLIYDQDVSSGDLASLETYMTDKWLP